MSEIPEVSEKVKIDYVGIYCRVFKNFFKFAPVSAVFSLLNYVIGSVFPAFTALALAALFDEAYRVAQGGGTLGSGSLYFWGLIYLAGYVVNNILTFITGLVIELGADKRQVHYRYLMCEKLSCMPLIDYENPGIRDMQQRAEDCLYSGRMNGIMRNSLGMLFLCLLNFLTLAAVLARYSAWFLPICVVSVLPYCGARLIRGKEFYRIKHRMAKKSRRLGYLWGLFTDRRSVKELRALGADDYVFERWTQCRDEVQDELWDQNRRDAVSLLICDVLRIVGYGACITLALFLTLNGTVNVGVFGACIAAFLTFQSATRNILVLGGELPRELAFAGDYFTYIDLPDESSDNGEKLNFSELKDRVEIRNVSFKYPNSKDYAVKNVSLEVRRGEKIAVIGENGSGKTTLSKLILGLYPSYEIEGDGVSGVFYDGVDVAEFNNESFHKTVSVVAQNFTQYKLPLRENIAMSNIGRLHDDEGIAEVVRFPAANGRR